jgi:hypothetical protein
MNPELFNTKYDKNLIPGFIGMAIHDADIIKYMDEEFEKEIQANKNFKYYQIKVKLNRARVYSTSLKNNQWEEHIDKIIQNKIKQRYAKTN